ncbi:MAG: LacI family DNA-binding transcriptional regulator [Capsulimonadaceae bacterium]|nr:LacI family DNA-binding transcriptional regulator [Capsulimonadaceae bacterium]
MIAMGITIREIAERLSVSEATVSRSLRNDPVINPATRARVNQFAVSVGYQGPSRRPRAARNPATRLARDEAKALGAGAQSIAVLLAVAEMSYAHRFGNIVRILQGITAEMDRAGVQQALRMIAPEGVANVRPGSADLPIILDTPGLAGIILEGRSSADFVAQAAKSVPVVTLARRYEDTFSDTVLSDNVYGIATLVERLADLGHERFAFVEDEAIDTFGEERYAGFLIGCARRGIDATRQRVIKREALVWFGLEIRLDRDALAEALAPPQPTAFVCMNDRAAWRLLAACRQFGLSAPDQISVTGFDNDVLTQIDGVSRDTSLTTIDPNFTEMGRYAVRMVLQRNARPDTPPLRTVVPYTFIPGSTIGPPPR